MGVRPLGWEDTLEESMATHPSILFFFLSFFCYFIFFFVFFSSTPVFLPGESHEQRNLAGHSPQGCKESDTTEAT